MSHIESENLYIKPLTAYITDGVEMGPGYPPHDSNGLDAVIHALLYIHQSVYFTAERDGRFQFIRREATDLMGIAMRRESPNLEIYL